MNAPSSLWNDPRLATLIAVVAVSLLIATVWLMRRKSRDGRGAAAICLVLSISLHGLLIYFLPALRSWASGSGNSSSVPTDTGMHQVTIADFNPLEKPTDSPGDASLTPDAHALVAPLPLALPVDPPPAPTAEVLNSDAVPAIETVAAAEQLPTTDSLPHALASSPEPAVASAGQPSIVDDLLSQWLSADAERSADPSVNDAATSESPVSPSSPAPSSSPAPPAPEASVAHPAHLASAQQNDFVQRAGDAKRLALLATGGDESTEAAVEAGLRFLAADQGADGAWNPLTSGAGRETMTLGTDRGGAGKRATNGITGLALLSMLGAGNTHLTGAYAENVRRGLSYLIRSQHPDGSLAGPATVYEANYCHGMAALAMCEAAAMTGDDSAMQSAAAAVRYTVAAQHPTTGGWRYVRGDPGDLSQLGWQAMVLDAGRRASIPVASQAFTGTARFLRSVRSGPSGGLASYRPGDGPTRTMTAEALATRLLLGETIPAVEITEAEAYLLRQPPGVGKDNYYGWYYSALALHQLQDDAWRQWNTSMKEHLIARQQPGGSWPTDDEWGGYGGRIYTTATATLCLEVYYRHAIRQNWIAEQPRVPVTKHR